MATSLESFPKFSKLPTELRLQIWRHVCCVRREAYLTFKNGEYRSLTKVPPVLATNQESRFVGRTFYVQVSGGQNPHEGPPIFINPGIHKFFFLFPGSIMSKRVSISDFEITDRVLRRVYQGTPEKEFTGILVRFPVVSPSPSSQFQQPPKELQINIPIMKIDYKSGIMYLTFLGIFILNQAEHTWEICKASSTTPFTDLTNGEGLQTYEESFQNQTDHIRERYI
ncbi:hypothetical protein HYFRA_00011077 [Hymenoscyphus fraxineus]|uniref:2EXR domain-containing protein n=1 Tax=Hymenoscyphus fraxineus TaxID=746836 RepID=A0A9N9PWK5_9HELO|nr:hypothetical protein HYFRA_00011077 [Hymenoscyphus fraxineus]